MAAILEDRKRGRPVRLDEKDWADLLRQISKGKCTPFIGPEVCKGLYLTKPQRSRIWAKQENYPLEDRSELARVAQFLAVRGTEATPITKLVEEFDANKPPDLDNPDEPHRVLADLPLPVYITTNYDNFMVQALTKRTMPRNPTREYCRWRNRMHGIEDVLAVAPTPANPIVFHLYGHTEVQESLVLTENDFLKFLANVSREQKRIPPVIQGAITGGSLLFLGYRLDEWDFRVLFHTLANYLVSSLTRAHISVQLVPLGRSATAEQIDNATKFLNLYFEKQYTKVYWGSSQEFVEELRDRWEESDYAQR
jgi:SIR2-like protein